MKIPFFSIIVVLGCLGTIFYNVKKPEVSAESLNVVENLKSESLPVKGKSPVLVELFTSEGCSSCPPADRNLIYLDEKQPFAQAEVITLAMHVDYWNRLGWTDPFSSAQFSERQGFYSDTFKLDGVYTPQMVVDGESEFVGGNLSEAQKAVNKAVKISKGDVALSTTGNTLQVKVADLPQHTLANVFLAIAEDNLSTAVGNGENGGKTLRHTSVVRELKTIGTVTAANNSFETETAFQLQPSWKKQNLKLVVFVQVEQTSQIIGVNQTRF